MELVNGILIVTICALLLAFGLWPAWPRWLRRLVGLGAALRWCR